MFMLAFYDAGVIYKGDWTGGKGGAQETSSGGVPHPGARSSNPMGSG